MEPIVLGIETSCDETAIAIYTRKGLLANLVYSQLEHQHYGGVVPELAAREHLKKLPILLKQALTEAKLDIEDITHIACTTGPGLIGALLVGYSFAQGLSASLKRPLIPTHHLEAHLAAAFIDTTLPTKPFLTLLISGGHTQIILTKGIGQYQLIGQTLDDAAGEAFDKTAKIMGLGYPGGPKIEAVAKQATNPITLPKALKQRKDAMMSFSGIKTAARQYFSDHETQPNIHANIAMGLQQCIAEQLCRKLNFAIAQTQVDTLVVSGGVSANQYIREQLKQHTNAQQLFFPDLALCTDNAAMVAYLGYLRMHDSHVSTLQARWPLASLKPPRDTYGA